MDLELIPPPQPGASAGGMCFYCQQPVEYKTLIMSLEIASYFDVRGGALYGRPLGMRINQLFGESYRPCLESFTGLCCSRK